MKRFEKYTHRQARSLISHLKEYERSPETETVHQIRVDIKKIKAILGAINYGNKGFKAHKSFIPFRNIFRRAGEIREPEVLIELLLRYQLAGIKDDQLGTDDTESLIAAFRSKIPQLITLVKSHTPRLETLSGHVSRHDFKRYLQKEKKLIRRQLFPKPSMRTIHKVRKNVKAIIYLSDIQCKLKSKEAKFYNNLQDTIGKLHDKQVLLGILRNQINETGNTQREIINLEYLSDKKEIVRLVNDYYKK